MLDDEDSDFSDPDADSEIPVPEYIRKIQRHWLELERHYDPAYSDPPPLMSDTPPQQLKDMLANMSPWSARDVKRFMRAERYGECPWFRPEDNRYDDVYHGSLTLPELPDRIVQAPFYRLRPQYTYTDVRRWYHNAPEALLLRELVGDDRGEKMGFARFWMRKFCRLSRQGKADTLYCELARFAWNELGLCKQSLHFGAGQLQRPAELMRIRDRIAGLSDCFAEAAAQQQDAGVRAAWREFASSGGKRSMVQPRATWWHHEDYGLPRDEKQRHIDDLCAKEEDQPDDLIARRWMPDLDRNCKNPKLERRTAIALLVYLQEAIDRAPERWSLERRTGREMVPLSFWDLRVLEAYRSMLLKHLPRWWIVRGILERDDSIALLVSCLRYRSPVDQPHVETRAQAWFYAAFGMSAHDVYNEMIRRRTEAYLVGPPVGRNHETRFQKPELSVLIALEKRKNPVWIVEEPSRPYAEEALQKARDELYAIAKGFDWFSA